MASQNFPSRPRIIGSNAHKYINRNVTIIGEVTSMTPAANTVTLRLPDDDTMIVLLDRNATTVEPNLLTEVTGKLISRGQLESSYIRQYDAKATAMFNKSLYVEAAQVYDAFRHHYDP